MFASAVTLKLAPLMFALAASAWFRFAPPGSGMILGYSDGENANVLSAHMRSKDQPHRCGRLASPTPAIISMAGVIK